MVNPQDTLTLGEAAKYIRRGAKTLQRWDREGLLVAGRTKTDRRVYTRAQLDEFVGRTAGGPASVTPTRVIAYCRVSSSAQRPDLKNQRATLEQFCLVRALDGVEYIEEIGGGLNFHRKQFLEIFDAIGAGHVKMLVIAHKDRLVRFGYEWFERHCKMHGCTILVLNQESLSPEQEMVQDLMTIVHCFSARLYGLRNYKKHLQKAIDAGASAPPC
jgi:predicted site-specific integrase-resolvase